jgi:hypothetical protein
MAHCSIGYHGKEHLQAKKEKSYEEVKTLVYGQSTSSQGQNVCHEDEFAQEPQHDEQAHQQQDGIART